MNSSLTMKVAPGSFQVDYDLERPLKAEDITKTKQDIQTVLSFEGSSLFGTQDTLYISARQRKKRVMPYLLCQQARRELLLKPERRWEAREAREAKEREYRQREEDRFQLQASRAHILVPVPLDNALPGAHLRDADFVSGFSENGRRTLALLPPIRSPRVVLTTPGAAVPLYANARDVRDIAAALLRRLGNHAIAADSDPAPARQVSPLLARCASAAGPSPNGFPASWPRSRRHRRHHRRERIQPVPRP
jgi:hypothetical protein